MNSVGSVQSTVVSRLGGKDILICLAAEARRDKRMTVEMILKNGKDPYEWRVGCCGKHILDKGNGRSKNMVMGKHVVYVENVE